MSRHLPIVNNCLFLLCFFWAVNASAQSLESIARENQAKLEKTIEVIKQQRKGILAERMPLIEELNRLESKASALRDEANHKRLKQENAQQEFIRLNTKIESDKAALSLIQQSLIVDYIASWDAQLSLGQRGTVGEELRTYYIKQDTLDALPLEKIKASMSILMNSLESIESSVGGQHYEGKVLGSNGKLQNAVYAQMGPLLYAYIPEKKLGGIVLKTEQRYPQLDEELSIDSSEINALIEKGQGNLPVDPTLGNAQKISAMEDSLIEHIQKGGFWVYPILLFAFVSTGIAIVKTIQIFRIRDCDAIAVNTLIRALRAGKKEEGASIAQNQPEPSRNLLHVAVTHWGESIELIEELMYEQMLAIQPRLERFLNVIAITAATAPLLGLLGTVTGIIKTFDLMQVYGSGHPQSMIGGISEALITTELGLILAIPAFVMHALLSRRVAGIISRMEQTSMAVVIGMSKKLAENHSPNKEL